MADHSDLGFVEDTQDKHDDLGFIPDTEQVSDNSSLDDMIGKIPLVGKPLRSLKEAQEDMVSSRLRSLFGGGGGKVEAAGRAGIDKLTGSSDDFSSLYDKYKGLVKQKQQEADLRYPIASTVGKVQGTLIPSVATAIATGPLGLAAEMGVGSLLGGVESAGSSESKDNTELAKDVGTGAVEGALMVPAGRAIGHGVSKGLSYLADAAGKNALAKQFAATVLNKVKGGTLFNQGELNDPLKRGTQTIQQETNALTGVGEDVGIISKELNDSLSGKNQAFTDAFKTATDAGKKLVPETSDLAIISTVEDIMGVDTANSLFSGMLEKLKAGDLNPQEADALRTTIKNHINRLKNTNGIDAIKATQQFNQATKLQNSGIIQSLEEMTQKSGVDLNTLNKEKSAAWNSLEAFPGIDQGKASSMSVGDRNKAMSTHLKDLATSSGKKTTIGDEEAINLKLLYDKLQKAKKVGNLNINPEEIGKKLNEQAYLNAARSNVSGYTQNSKQTLWDSIKDLKPKKLSIYGAAEALSGNKGVQNVSKFLLEADNERLLGVANRLKGDPAYAHLGNSLADAVEKTMKPQINAVIFSLMQNPATRALVQGMQESITPEM